jgi:putative ABC transport system ATP-binding protein
MGTNGKESLIVLDGVTKVFVTDEVETHALSGIQLDLKKGEYLSIAGPSGCGKSTLLAILGLLDTPSDGTYTLNSRPVSGLKLSERARIRNREIGFIFQAFNLIGDLTVYENVELPLTYRGMGSAERKKRVQEALERVGMSHRMKHYPSQLSGGQQQRVAVARALGGDPAILLADEPTGNLDSANGEAVMNLLKDLHRNGATICMVTHDPRYAQFADRTIRMFDGGSSRKATRRRGIKAAAPPRRRHDRRGTSRSLSTRGGRMLLASAPVGAGRRGQPAGNRKLPSRVQPDLSSFGAWTSVAPKHQRRCAHSRLGPQ